MTLLWPSAPRTIFRSSSTFNESRLYAVSLPKPHAGSVSNLISQHAVPMTDGLSRLSSKNWTFHLLCVSFTCLTPCLKFLVSRRTALSIALFGASSTPFFYVSTQFSLQSTHPNVEIAKKVDHIANSSP